MAGTAPGIPRRARASPPATAIARTGLRSAARPVRRCDREVRGPVRPRGRGLWRSVPAVRPPAGAARPPRGRPRASAGERVNRTKSDNRRATGTAGRGVRQHGRCRRFFCGHVHVVRTQAPHRKRTHVASPRARQVQSAIKSSCFDRRFCVCSFVHAQCPEQLYRRLTGVGSGYAILTEMF